MEHMAEEFAFGNGRVRRLKELFSGQEKEKTTSSSIPKLGLGLGLGLVKDLGAQPSEDDTLLSERIASNVQRFQHEEHQYLHLVDHILEQGVWEEGRNGRTQSVFGHSMRFSLRDGIIPILTTKKMAWKTCLKELLWFVRGETDNCLLKAQGVHIWDANGTREFLDSRGLTHYDVDELGPIYGRQWRHFNKPYYSNQERKHILEAYDSDCDVQILEDYKKLHEEGIDQLKQIVDALKDPAQRTSRRLILTAWNPQQLDQMALPPCHVMCQFHVQNGNQLSCALYQRSCDVALGVPFNIASYCFLTHLLAHHCGLQAHEFVHFMGNCHLYEDHVLPIQTQLTRTPHPFPKVYIRDTRENIQDYKVQDFEVHDYVHHEPIEMKMIA